MRAKEFTGGYYLVFEPGDKVIENFTNFCIQKNINSGVFSGIGAFNFASIGHYNTVTRRYTINDFNEALEVLNINGNVTLKEKLPFVHMHAMLSDKNMKVIGGHVTEAEVSVTLEVYLRVFNETLERRFDEKLGLHVIK
ncbi:MAG: DUF296 domain-containing protein [Candidatus Muirbacterium halophilum]|nr:DUF296 domain-containing protein [Candidatus Muirbacterium halophilum]MCK9474842.1 DUF296 domain-containing protein [Candidatus Muirbacterium halophilum]